MTDRPEDDQITDPEADGTAPSPSGVTEATEEILAELEHAHHASRSGPPPTGLDAVLYRVRTSLDGLADFTGGLSWRLAWVVFVLGLFNVITRYLARFIERDIIIGEIFDLQWMLFGLLFLLGFNYGMKEGVNPRIDFWWANFAPKKKAWIDIVIHALMFLPFCWMAISILWGYALTALGRSFDGSWATWKVWEIWEQSSDAGGLPRGPIKTMLLIGFTLLALQTIAEMIKNYFVLRDRPDLAGIAEHEAPLRVE